jgi:glycosyltransferase involved in cell wall biosynthesis
MAFENHNSKLVSVIIPAFNAADFIGETLSSVLSQSYKNIELIVVDDGSNDNTRTVVESFGNKIKYIYQANSGGCSSPRNNGFRHSSGKFLHFFDADDLMLPNNIEEKVAYLLNHPDVGMVCSDYRNFRANNQQIELEPSHFSTCPIIMSMFRANPTSNSLHLTGDQASEIILRENYTISGSVMFPRDVFEEVGTYDEALTSSEDFDIHYRTLLSHDCGIIKNTGFHRRLHNANMTSNPIKMFTNGIRSAEKLLSLETSITKKRLLQKRILRRLFGLSRHYRGTDSFLSLRYSLKALIHISAFDKMFWSRFLRNTIAAAIRFK